MRSPILAILVLILGLPSAPCAASELVPLGAPVSLLGEPSPDDEFVRGGVAVTSVADGFTAVWHEIGYQFDHVASIHLGALGEVRGESVIYDWNPRSLGYPSCPTLATLAPDRVIMAWTLRDYLSGPHVIAFRRFSVDGAAVDSMVRVVRAPLGAVLTADCPIAAGHENGGFALAWSSYTSPSRAQAQGFKPTGERSTSILELATATGRSGPPALVLDGAGRIILAADDQAGAIWGERFSAAGVPFGEVFRIGRGGGEVALAAVPSGGFVAAWSRGEVGGRQILIRRYGADGRPRGLPKVVGKTRGFLQPILRVDREGRSVLFWIDESRHLVGRLFEMELSPAGGLTDLGPIGPTNVWVNRAGLALLGRRVLAVWFGPPLEANGTPPLLGQLFDIRP